MDFPSHSSKLATRHANKGDAPPAPSHETESCSYHVAMHNKINIDENDSIL